MPKDKITVLADPDLQDIIYVAANAGALCYRINTTAGVWDDMGARDTSDHSEPHGDCRCARSLACSFVHFISLSFFFLIFLGLFTSTQKKNLDPSPFLPSLQGPCMGLQ